MHPFHVNLSAADTPRASTHYYAAPRQNVSIPAKKPAPLLSDGNPSSFCNVALAFVLALFQRYQRKK